MFILILISISLAVHWRPQLTSLPQQVLAFLWTHTFTTIKAVTPYRNQNSYCISLFILACISFYYFIPSHLRTYHTVNTFTLIIFFGTLSSTHPISNSKLITFPSRYFIPYNWETLHLCITRSIHIFVVILDTSTVLSTVLYSFSFSSHCIINLKITPTAV